MLGNHNRLTWNSNSWLFRKIQELVNSNGNSNSWIFRYNQELVHFSVRFDHSCVSFLLLTPVYINYFQCSALLDHNLLLFLFFFWKGSWGLPVTHHGDTCKFSIWCFFGCSVSKNIINFAILVAVLIDTRCRHHPDASASALSHSVLSSFVFKSR